MMATCIVGLGTPMTARADDKPRKTKKAAVQPVKTARESRIKHRTVTGSHLPQTYEQRGIKPNTSQNVTVYDRHDLEKTGNLSVGSSLKRLDPSISISGTY